MKNEILIVKGGRKINKKFLNFSMQKTYEYQLSEVLRKIKFQIYVL